MPPPELHNKTNKISKVRSSRSSKTNPAARRAKPKVQSDKQLLKELDSQYKKWLDEDVVYIISPEERNAFIHLQTNEEREQFIEAFWQRRNPDPDSPENTFKEEHYRRIAYANEHFASGVPGWKTDRGRIYIAWGPPDERDEHTAGRAIRPTDGSGRRHNHNVRVRNLALSVCGGPRREL